MPRNSKLKSVSEDGTRLKKSANANAMSQDGGDAGDKNKGVAGVNNDVDGAIGGAIEITECNLCAEEVSEEGQKAIMCQKCSSWTHQACANLNNQEMKALEKGRHNIMWFCNTCTAEVAKMIKGKSRASTLASDNLSLINVVNKLDEVAEKLNKLTELMNKREGNIDKLVETKVKPVYGRER